MQNRNIFNLGCLLLLISLSGCTDTSKEEIPSSDSDSEIHENIIGGDVYERPYSPSFGVTSAKVTIVEFFDPGCESCRAFYPLVKDILSRHPEDVRVVLRYATFHEGSETVVRMLEAARIQNIFIPVLESLLKDQQLWASHHKPDINKAWDIAEAAGLNLVSAKEVMYSKEIDQLIAQDKDDIRSLKVKKTPTFFVNKKPLPYFGQKPLYDLVISELKK
ncbi:MAG: protein-disulfide isomerase [Oleiphilaceae bacterium]|jgi:protein-disulfide isomerase